MNYYRSLVLVLTLSLVFVITFNFLYMLTVTFFVWGAAPINVNIRIRCLILKEGYVPAYVTMRPITAMPLYHRIYSAV